MLSSALVCNFLIRFNERNNLKGVRQVKGHRLGLRFAQALIKYRHCFTAKLSV